MTTIFVLIAMVCGSSNARENRKGLEAWQRKDTAAAIQHLEKAARDTTDPRYGFNLGTVKSLARQPDADSVFGRSLQIAKDSLQRARTLYNRGTARLEAARSGKGDPSAAAQDFRDALKLKPGWQEAGRNLELALRMAQQNKNKPKNDQDKKDPKNQPKDQPKDQNPKDSSDQNQPPKPQPNGMDKQDAQRLLDAAKAQEGKQLKRPARKEETDGPDW